MFSRELPPFKSIVRLDKNVFFAAYYTLAAYAVCNVIGLSTELIQMQLNAIYIYEF